MLGRGGHVRRIERTIGSQQELSKGRPNNATRYLTSAKCPPTILPREGDVIMQSVTTKAVNVATVPQLSPFRYPGGKTWLIPWIRTWLKSLGAPIQCLVEPFAGGGAVSLASVYEGLANQAILIELDEEIGVVWRALLGGKARKLAQRVESFSCTHAEVERLLASSPRSIEGRALKTLVINRTRYGGILAPGAALVKQGENGRGISSRWYPQTLKKRILAVARYQDRLRFVQGDGMAFMRESLHMKNTAFYIDPPYTVAGRRLYKYSDIDHDQLFQVVSRLESDFLMTYDDASEIRALALKHRLEVEEIPMRSTKHELKQELLIGRDLSWARQGLAPHLGDDPLFKVTQANGASRSQTFNGSLKGGEVHVLQG